MESKGRKCDSCGKQLSEEEFEKYGSWNYTCEKCGFSYKHSSSKTAKEQVEEFEKEQN
jgi:predicted RNA-binding Zn-ribbon protein involved in translation (DUF1610 family)